MCGPLRKIQLPARPRMTAAPFGWRLAMLLSAMAAATAVAAAQPRGYPRSYDDIIAAAQREGTVVVYSTTDKHEVVAALAAFRAHYPFLRVDYRELASPELYDRVIAESRARKPTGDLVWSSAMDLQIKLVNDGYAQAYASPEKPYLPDWAIWKNEAWGVTAEPIVIAYNRRLVPAQDGVNLDADDVGHGAVDVKFYTSTRPLLADLENGSSLFAYNALGSYALELATRNPDIAVIMPADYTLVVSRIALIAREARQPNAARLLLDFLLSIEGQRQLARAYMAPSRKDVEALPGSTPPANAARPVRLGPALLADLDRIRRERILATWQAALEAR